jgi:hypothetical protein
VISNELLLVEARLHAVLLLKAAVSFYSDSYSVAELNIGISVSGGSSNGSDTAYPKYAFGRCEHMLYSM